MKKKAAVKKEKKIEIVEHKRVQTAEGRRRAFLREMKLSKSKAA